MPRAEGPSSPLVDVSVEATAQRARAAQHAPRDTQAQTMRRRDNVADPFARLADPSHKPTLCGALHFIVPCLGELLSNCCWRSYRSVAIKCARSLCDLSCAASCTARLPTHINDITAQWLAAALGHPPEMIDSISMVPLAIEEGFTSSLYVVTIRWGATQTPALAGSMPEKVVLKMLPQWSVGEQLTSAMQLQHTKEAWVIENWENMGCRVPRGFYTATRPTAGDFMHVMEYMDNTTAGDQLSTLPVDQAVAAAVEIAKMHAKFWGSHEPGKLSTCADGHDDHERRRRPIPSGALACDRWCFGGDSRYGHSNKLREAWMRMPDGVEIGVGPPGGWEQGFDGLANNKRVLAALAKKKGLKAVTTLEGLTVEMLPVLEHLLSPPQTLIHGDLRSANVMFPRQSLSSPPSSFAEGVSSTAAGSPVTATDSAAGSAIGPRPAVPEASEGRPCIIDWGGLQRGKGVFDVAYLLGTGMSHSQRQAHQEKVLREYHRALGEGGVDLTRYSWDQLMVDYEAALFLSAVLYAMPGVYDRGTTTEENAEAAKDVGLALGRNLQPVLDALGALNSDAHLQRHNRDTKSDAGGVGLFKHS